MVQKLFDQNIIIYTFAVLCGLGILVRFILNLVYKHLVKESDKVGTTKNKKLLHMKMKFETCFKLKIGVNNVDTFVDKNVLSYRLGGILLSTWDNFGGQVLFLILLIVPVGSVFGVAFRCGQEKVLLTGAVGILTSAVLIFVDKSINLVGKKKMLRLNLLDYLENFCKVRLEQEALSPEMLEQFRREYFQSVEANKQISAALVAAPVKDDSKDELNRRREARRKKEEDKKLQALKREEEQKRNEEARKEEEKRKLEERRQIAARRREEELLKMQEEREALEARRAEIKKKAEQKQLSNERKKQQSVDAKKILHSLEQELKPVGNRTGLGVIIKEMDEIAAEKEDTLLLKEEIEQPQTENVEIKQVEQENGESRIKEIGRKEAPSKLKIQGMSPQEEKLIEDVLKEFFA